MMLEDLYRLLRSGHIQAQGVVDTMTQPVVVLDRGMCVTTANNAFLKTFEVERDEVLEGNFFELGDGQWNIPELRHLIADVIPKAAAVIGYEVTHDFPSIGPRTFLVDARRLVHPDGNSTSILILFDDVTDSQRHDSEKDLIISELRHRMKNLFAVIRSLAMQTEAEGRTGIAYRDVLLGRLEVTLEAQEIAATSDTADLETLVKRSVNAIGAKRVSCSGPPIEVGNTKIVPLSLIFHELATNAAKYGALSNHEGKINVSWSVKDGPRERPYLRCEWREQKGPPVKPPQSQGYGTHLIAGMTSNMQGSAELNYDPEGLVAVLEIRM